MCEIMEEAIKYDRMETAAKQLKKGRITEEKPWKISTSRRMKSARSLKATASASGDGAGFSSKEQHEDIRRR